MDNQSIADAFSLTGKLMEIHGENSFKAKGYSIAAYNIERLQLVLEDLEESEIFSIKGIGDAIGKKILELNKTGELKVLKDILEKTPPGVLDMMGIKGLGPKKVTLLWKELGIESLGELLYACDENRLTLYKGFGAKTQANIKENIEFFLQNQDRFLFAHIEPFALELEKALQRQFPGQQVALTGTLRRQMEIIDEVEMVTTVSFEALQVYLAEQGITISDVEPGKLVAKGTKNLPLIWYAASPENFGTRLFETSADSAFLDAWPTSGGAWPTEAAHFEAAGVPYIIPARRETASVIGKTQHSPLQVSDIKGIIHSHSDWSDGAHTLEKMAFSAKEQGFEYLVISDHSKSAFYANGLTEERIMAQHEQIAELNERFAPFRIFKSVESDILYDGRLDYSDQVLGTFDLVIASVHSNLRMPRDKAMQRLLTAISNPYTTILGHPTGRLLLSRKGYPVDPLALLDACAEHQVVMELNAHPRRLDMDWRWLDEALARGVLTSVDPDAHSVEGFDDIRYGVLAAQKTGIGSQHNLSSYSREHLEQWLAARRRARGI